MRRALLLTLVPAALLAGPTGCGGDDGPGRDAGRPAAADAVRPADLAVIRRWAAALRRGDPAAAARLFALPSVAENGPAVHIRSRADARRFNAALPCGAEVVDAVRADRFTTVTFRLRERPGGACGAGAGGTARTAFVIRDGRIREWYRVLDDGPPLPPPGSVAPPAGSGEAPRLPEPRRPGPALPGPGPAPDAPPVPPRPEDPDAAPTPI